jgi:hypothetical protein
MQDRRNNPLNSGRLTLPAAFDDVSKAGDRTEGSPLNETSSLFPILRPENGRDLPVVY